MNWRAATSVDYHFSMESGAGLTGAYTVWITPAGAPVDDHGDNAAIATEVSIGEVTEGFIGDDADVDLLRFKAVQGYGYEVLVDNSTLDFSRVEIYQSDGMTSAGDWTSAGWVRKGAHFEWSASANGVYHIAIWSPPGNAGAYTLSVTEFPRWRRPRKRSHCRYQS